MSIISTLLVGDTLDAVRDQIVGFCVTQGLKVTNWVAHGVVNQMKEVCVSMGGAVSGIRARVVRGFYSLDTATDPGDYDPFDEENINRPQEEGYLSDHGLNVHGITRGKATFAKGFALFSNDGTSSRNIAPEGLTFEWKDDQNKTWSYRNIGDSTIYTNPDGTVTVPVGTSVLMPVECNQLGAGGSCPSDSISLVTSLIGCTATNPDPIVGSARQDAENYRAVCRSSSARLSLNGPGAIYDYLARYNLDGTQLLRSTDPAIPVDITRTWVSEESSTGIVVAYFATDSGSAIQQDVDAANKNIEEYACAVMDAITYSGSAATETVIQVAGTARIKNRPGLNRTTIINSMLQQIIAAQKTFPIGGLDQNEAGSGYVYRNDLEAIARSGFFGLYDVEVTSIDYRVVIPTGHVAVFASSVSDWSVTLV